MPEIFIIAGCNGAGKTTAAFNLLPGVFKTVEFVNADEIARGLSPLNMAGVSFQAGKIMLKRIYTLMNEHKSFAFETTLSGLNYLSLLEDARSKLYTITLFFVYLDSPELAKERVAIRVAKGGHDIPEIIIERRYQKGLKNLKKYSSKVDNWYIFDNSGREYELVAKSIDKIKEVCNFEIYNKIDVNGQS